jgi:hypothetical protein
MEPALTAKVAALLNYKRNPCEKTLAAYSEARNLKHRSDIKTSAICGNTRAMYEGMKKAFGTSVTKTVPLKSTSGELIKDRGEQMERWVEHYVDLYSKENVGTDTAMENTTPLPTMEELDSPPTIEELSKAIDSLSCRKAPGSDGIPPEVAKAAKQSAFLGYLHKLLLQFWE